jgi:hypothetical protein
MIKAYPTEDLLERLDAYCASTGASRSAVVSLALEEFLVEWSTNERHKRVVLQHQGEPGNVYVETPIPPPLTRSSEVRGKQFRPDFKKGPA